MSHAGCGVVLWLQVALAFACGHCIEDKIAAVYDHAAVTQALASRRQIAYFAMDGGMTDNPAQRRMIERTVGQVRGVDRRSVRISIASSALAVAFDPTLAPLNQLEHSLQRSFALKGISLQLMRVMDHPAELNAVALP